MKNVTISIKGLSLDTESDEAAFELITEGEYSSDNKISEFSYMESELTGFVGTQTRFHIEPDKIIMSRGDGEISDMIFSEKQKHHFVYDTPFGSMTMGIDTQSITIDMNDDGGHLEIKYRIDVDNVIVSRNLFKISVKPSGQHAGQNMLNVPQ